MSEVERYAIGYVVALFLGLAIMVIFFSRKRWVAWSQRFAKLQRMALSYLAGLGTALLMWLVMVLIIGQDALITGFYFCWIGPGAFLILQHRFSSGKLKKSAFARHTEFDERDYRIGQNAIHAAYVAFWIAIFAASAVMYIAVSALQLKVPWSIYLLLPAVALVVSLVHAVTILLSYRKAGKGVEENG